MTNKDFWEAFRIVLIVTIIVLLFAGFFVGLAYAINWDADNSCKQGFGEGWNKVNYADNGSYLCSNGKGEFKILDEQNED